MRVFKTKDGFEWPLDINFTTLKRVRSLTGHDFFNPLTPPQPLLHRARIDASIVIDAIFAIVKPLADERRISDEQFGANLGGDLGALAISTFWDELADFFMPLNPASAEMIREMGQTVAKIFGLAKETVRIQLDQAVSAAQAQLTGIGSAASTPASSESTPAP